MNELNENVGFAWSFKMTTYSIMYIFLLLCLNFERKQIDWVQPRDVVKRNDNESAKTLMWFSKLNLFSYLVKNDKCNFAPIQNHLIIIDPYN